MPETYVYVMETDQKNIYKIGFSINPNERSKAVSSTTKFNIVNVVRTYATDKYREIESMLHVRYSSYRVTGEFFRLNKRLLKRLMQDFDKLALIEENIDDFAMLMGAFAPSILINRRGYTRVKQVIDNITAYRKQLHELSLNDKYERYVSNSKSNHIWFAEAIMKILLTYQKDMAMIYRLNDTNDEQEVIEQLVKDYWLLLEDVEQRIDLIWKTNRWSHNFDEALWDKKMLELKSDMEYFRSIGVSYLSYLRMTNVEEYEDPSDIHVLLDEIYQEILTEGYTPEYDDD